MEKKYWVCMTDRFMSGWGYAEDKINKLVLECDTMEEAEIVAANARRREEMKYVNIRYGQKPYYNTRDYYTSYHGKTDYARWYRPNQFGEVK